VTAILNDTALKSKLTVHRPKVNNILNTTMGANMKQAWKGQHLNQTQAKVQIDTQPGVNSTQNNFNKT
jgi:hypothetical protein